MMKLSIDEFKRWYPEAAAYLNEHGHLLDSSQGCKEFLFNTHENINDHSEHLSNLEVRRLIEIVESSLEDSYQINLLDCAKECLLESFADLYKHAPQAVIGLSIYEVLVNHYGSISNIFGLKMTEAIAYIEQHLDQLNLKLTDNSKVEVK